MVHAEQVRVAPGPVVRTRVPGERIGGRSRGLLQDEHAAEEVESGGQRVQLGRSQVIGPLVARHQSPATTRPSPSRCRRQRTAVLVQ